MYLVMERGEVKATWPIPPGVSSEVWWFQAMDYLLAATRRLMLGADEPGLPRLLVYKEPMEFKTEIPPSLVTDLIRLWSWCLLVAEGSNE